MLRIFSDPLYHGTIDRISQIDVAKGKLRKDFGRGFYMALNVQQAVGMTADKANTVVGLCVVDLTKHIMDREGLQLDAAYRKLYSTELYKLLANPETRLFLEDEDYLRKAYDTEASSGVEALYAFIKPES